MKSHGLNRYAFPVVLLSLIAVTSIYADSSDKSYVSIDVDKKEIGMGRTVAVSVQVESIHNETVEGNLLLPYVNGKRWGAHGYTDRAGHATLLLPLPNPGIAEIQVEARPPSQSAQARWIWSPEIGENQTVFLQGSFQVPESVTSAKLWIASDNRAKVYLNGTDLGEFNGWTNIRPVKNIAEKLRLGTNILSVEASNLDGPAGVILRLEMETKAGTVVATSNESWRCYPNQPQGWPDRTGEESESVKTLGFFYHGPAGRSLRSWPNAREIDGRMAGQVMPRQGCFSQPLQVRVYRRELETIPSDPEHLVGFQWEPWFTPWACSWTTGHAVPLVGLYWSWNPDVIRQHMIWMVESGADFLVVDWTNHLWGKEHWDERHDNTNTIIHATTITLETLAAMREEGLPVPKLVLYLGVQNGPQTTMTAVNEEIDWIYNNYIRNPRFKGLFLEYLGKPLLMIHNGSGPRWLRETNQPPVNDEHFTIRWQSSQHQINNHNELGYWSWMDGSLEQKVTYYEGKAECLTVSTAFFDGKGWLSEGSYGRRGGWTYVESFKGALKYRPRFIELHQFQEFAGQFEGNGYGPKHDHYVDSYSVEFSDDIEPVSLDAPGYRGEGGWGFFYLNLTRALVDLYRQETPATTVVAIGQPANGAVITDDEVEVVWTSVGKSAESFSIAVNGNKVAEDLEGTSAVIDLSGFEKGPLRLVLTAEGTQSRYVLSRKEESLPLSEPVSASVGVDFVLKRD